MTFQVVVELTITVPYIVTADSREDAEKVAIERAHDGMGLMNGDVIDATVVDIADETAEHESSGPAQDRTP